MIIITLFNLISRSLLYKKGRNIILLCLFSFLFYILITVGTISIATRKQVSYLNRTVGNMVIVQKNSGENFSSRDIEILTDNDYVEEYNIPNVYVGFFNGIKPYVKDKDAYEKFLERAKKANYLPNDCTLISLTNSNYHSLFSSGGFKLTNGSHITSSDSENEIAIISKQLADENNLRLGDTITISVSTFSQSFGVPLKITGFYEYIGDIASSPSNPANDLVNYIFVPSDTLKSSPNLYYGMNQLTLYLKDPSLIEEFKEEINKKLEETLSRRARISFDYEYIWNEEWFNIIGKPVQAVNNLTTSMVIIIAIGTYMVILLISTLVLAEKKREIGIYLSMGKSKIKVIFQIVAEQMFIILLSFLIAGGVSLFTSENISKAFMNTSATEINKQLAQQRGAEERRNGYYLIERSIMHFSPNFFYVQNDVDISNSLDKLIQYAFLGIIIIMVSLTCQVLIFIGKNSIVTLLKKS